MRLLVVMMTIASSMGFVPYHKTRWNELRIQEQEVVLKLAAAESPQFDDDEVEKMEETILSLSLIPTDESRRTQLQLLFYDELEKPDDDGQHFAKLFDHTLIIVGDRIKQKAQEVALKMQEEKEAEETGDKQDNDEDEDKDEDDEADENQSESEAEDEFQAFPEQRQLWALVDMMVQSKAIVKNSLRKP